MNVITRRTFLKTALAGAVTSALPRFLRAEDETFADVVVVHGKDLPAMLDAGVGKLGGWAAFVARGRKATIKPNAGWANPPEDGSNTHPALVGAAVRACLAAGASEVVVPENPCSPPQQAFQLSGIAAAVREAGGKMVLLREDRLYRRTPLPDARTLREADIAVDVLETGCLINMPVAKHHSGAGLTLSMKNWMGAVKDRGFWHRNNLHQCIADFSTRVRPTLVVIDASRILLEHGPRGPGPLKHTDQIILSRDPVAADACAATLFDRKPFDIPHIRIAHEMKIGCGDLSRIRISHLKV